MDDYNFQFSRQLTEEEAQEVAELFDGSSDEEIFDDSDADPNFQPESDESDFDDFTIDQETLQDIALFELQQSIEAQDEQSMTIQEVDVFMNREEHVQCISFGHVKHATLQSSKILILQIKVTRMVKAIMTILLQLRQFQMFNLQRKDFGLIQSLIFDYFFHFSFFIFR